MSSPFLQKLESAEASDLGIYFFRDFIDEDEQADLLTALDSNEFPWDLKPVLFGMQLPQHAYLYLRQAKQQKRFPILSRLESICERMEREFDGRISSVYCNRFQDPTHHIPYHRDTYGEHILVLSLGSERIIEFRRDKDQVVTRLEPHAGDVYFMPLRLNSTYMHRVCAGPEDSGTRLSFVFFFKTPKYAKEYRITAMDRIRGAFTSIME